LTKEVASEIFWDCEVADGIRVVASQLYVLH